MQQRRVTTDGIVNHYRRQFWKTGDKESLIADGVKHAAFWRMPTGINGGSNGAAMTPKECSICHQIGPE